MLFHLASTYRRRNPFRRALRVLLNRTYDAAWASKEHSLRTGSSRDGEPSSARPLRRMRTIDNSQFRITPSDRCLHTLRSAEALHERLDHDPNSRRFLQPYVAVRRSNCEPPATA